jgi:hypothetical protein
MIGHLNDKKGCFPESCVLLMSDESMVDSSSVSVQSSRKLLPISSMDPDFEVSSKKSVIEDTAGIKGKQDEQPFVRKTFSSDLLLPYINIY